MNLPTDVVALEAELACVRAMCDEDEKRVAQSATPEIDRIFLGSTQKLRREIERRLAWAKAERQRRNHRLAELARRTP